MTRPHQNDPVSSPWAYVVFVLVVIVLFVASCQFVLANDEAKPKYIGWIMVMWPTYDVTQKYTVIGAERDYDKCVKKIPVMALALKFPKGAKVDCIDKQYDLTQVEK